MHHLRSSWRDHAKRSKRRRANASATAAAATQRSRQCRANASATAAAAIGLPAVVQPVDVRTRRVLGVRALDRVLLAAAAAVTAVAAAAVAAAVPLLLLLARLPHIRVVALCRHIVLTLIRLHWCWVCDLLLRLGQG